MRQRIDLFGGRIDRCHLPDEPCRAVGVGIELRLQSAVPVGDDEVARVEHIVDLRVHRDEVAVDEVLVALQLGAVVAAHGAVEVGGGGVAEGAHREVGHPVARCGILQDRLVRLGGVELCAPRRHEVVPREVAHVGRKKVETHQSGEAGDQYAPFHAVFGVEQYEPGRHEYEEQRTPCVGPEHLRPFGGHGIRYVVGELPGSGFIEAGVGGDVVEQRVVARCGEAEHLRSEEDEEQCGASRDARGPGESFPQFRGGNPALPELHEQQAGQQGECPLYHDQGRGNRPEFVVAGKYTEAELREPHHVASPGEKECQYAHRQQPPFPVALQHEQAEHGEENHHRAQVGGTGRSGLVAPIGPHGQIDGAGTEMGEHVGYRAVRSERLCRRTSREVRDEQVETLCTAVAPGRGVFQVESALRSLGSAVGGGQLRAAPRGVGGVLRREVERCEVGAYGQRGGQQEGARRFPEARQRPAPEGPYEFVDEQGEYDQQEVVGDLRVVGRYFEGGGQCRQRGPEPEVSSAVGVDDRSDQQGYVGQGPHFGDVARSDDEDRVGREAVSQRRNDAHPRVHLPQQRHEPEAEHGREDEHRRFAHRPHGQFRGVAYDPCRNLEVDHVGGHAAERTARPLRIFAVLLHVAFDVRTRPHVLRDVVHVELFAPELGGEIEHRNQQKDDGGCYVGQPAEVFPLFVHGGRLFSYPAK